MGVTGLQVEASQSKPVCLYNVINASDIAPIDPGTLQQAYLEKIPLSALVSFAIAGGWEQTSFMRRHFCTLH